MIIVGQYQADDDDARRARRLALPPRGRGQGVSVEDFADDDAAAAWAARRLSIAVSATSTEPAPSHSPPHYAVSARRDAGDIAEMVIFSTPFRRHRPHSRKDKYFLIIAARHWNR